MQRKMDVGAGCEDLRARCPYFYEVACKVHVATGSDQVADFVNNTFRARYKVGPSSLPVSAEYGDLELEDGTLADDDVMQK
jgi:hypothetical protein